MDENYLEVSLSEAHILTMTPEEHVCGAAPADCRYDQEGRVWYHPPGLSHQQIHLWAGDVIVVTEDGWILQFDAEQWANLELIQEDDGTFIRVNLGDDGVMFSCHIEED